MSLEYYVLLDKARLPELAARADALIVDAPGWSDVTTVELGQRADLAVIPTGCSTDYLRPATRLFHELVAGEVSQERIAVVINNVGTSREATFARGYLEQGGVPSATVIEPTLPTQPTFRERANGGQAASEVPHKGPRDAAVAVAAALIARGKALGSRQTAKPARFKAGTW